MCIGPLYLKRERESNGLFYPKERESNVLFNLGERVGSNEKVWNEINDDWGESDWRRNMNKKEREREWTKEDKEREREMDSYHILRNRSHWRTAHLRSHRIEWVINGWKEYMWNCETLCMCLCIELFSSKINWLY